MAAGHVQDPQCFAVPVTAWGGDVFGGQRGLSRFLCKLIYGLLVEVGVEAVGVGQGEGAEGLFPALDDASFDEFGFGAALVGG